MQTVDGEPAVFAHATDAVVEAVVVDHLAAPGRRLRYRAERSSRRDLRRRCHESKTGVLYDFFDEISSTGSPKFTPRGESVACITSSDGGATRLSDDRERLKVHDAARTDEPDCRGRVADA